MKKDLNEQIEDLTHKLEVYEEQYDFLAQQDSDEGNMIFDKIRDLENKLESLGFKLEYGSTEEFNNTMNDVMFPNRHDDDFDEDAMSYNSVYGDD